MNPVLYSFRRCPYAMRARMALIASGQRVELREVVLRDKPEAMIAASPKATVPVLVLPEGGVIDESLDIMRWALAGHDPEGWLSGDDAALITSNDGPFKQHLDRYKYATRYRSDPQAHRAEAVRMLMDLEVRLSRNIFLCGDRRMLSDIAIFPFVRQFAATEPDWFAGQPLTRVRAWLDGLVRSALFSRAMLRLPAWREGDTPVYL
ncbi:glutathione S-transferase [Sphingobium bisphenolivorans]|uniref:glutathione S-transferase n=1 Tax=Sphingobium bisphenolivorans TaxID=1335760 RepID=UPI0003A777D6|nr:glutathione S-transferase [Sphingobium bisphenolivorans]